MNQNTATNASPADEADWKRMTRRTVYDNPWIRVYHDEVVNPNGGHGIYGVVHFKNLAVGVLPVDEEGWTWLVGQKRYPLDSYTWEIPEGGGAMDVDPLESARRELQEEVGLTAAHWTPILETQLSNSATDERCFLFLARGLSTVLDNPDPTEKLTLRHLPLDEAIEMVDSGHIVDSLSVMALLWADRAKRRGIVRW